MAEPGVERKDVEAVPATDVRERLTELMGRAEHRNDRFLFTVHGRSTAALVSVRDFERLQSLDAEQPASSAA
jgi:prevent-host-death family protein